MLKYFDYSYNANKIDNLLYAIISCHFQLSPSDWNFLLKNQIIVYVNTGLRIVFSDNHVLNTIRNICDIVCKLIDRLPVRLDWWTLQLDIYSTLKSLFCPIEMTKNTKIQLTINCIK